MQSSNKEKHERVSSGNKGPKSKTEAQPICPSRLSKRELEEVYYSLLQENVDLRTTVSNLNEKNKLLTTKLQRITSTTKLYTPKDMKENGVNAKAMINEQKQIIQDLKRANKQLKDQIHLNVPCPTANQFPIQSTMQQTAPAENRSTSTDSLNTHRLANCLNERVKAMCCRCLRLYALPPQLTSACVDTEDLPLKLCDENKCRTFKEEMKQKIAALEKELVDAHDQYLTRISDFEKELAALESEKLRARREQARRDSSLDRRASDNKQLREKLSEYQSRCDELATSLSIEKSKVAELQTQLKAYSITSNTIKAIEQQMNEEKSSAVLKYTEEQPSKSIQTDKKKESSDLKRNEGQLRLASIPSKQRSLEQEEISVPVQTEAIPPTKPMSENKENGHNNDVCCESDNSSCKCTPSESSEQKSLVSASVDARPPPESYQKSAVDASPQKLNDSGFSEANKSFNDEKVLKKMNKELMSKIADLQTQLDSLKKSISPNKQETIPTSKGATKDPSTPCRSISSAFEKIKIPTKKTALTETPLTNVKDLEELDQDIKNLGIEDAIPEPNDIKAFISQRKMMVSIDQVPPDKRHSSLCSKQNAATESFAIPPDEISPLLPVDNIDESLGGGTRPLADVPLSPSKKEGPILEGNNKRNWIKHATTPEVNGVTKRHDSTTITPDVTGQKEPTNQEQKTSIYNQQPKSQISPATPQCCKPRSLDVKTTQKQIKQDNQLEHTKYEETSDECPPKVRNVSTLSEKELFNCQMYDTVDTPSQTLFVDLKTDTAINMKSDSSVENNKRVTPKDQLLDVRLHSLVLQHVEQNDADQNSGDQNKEQFDYTSEQTRIMTTAGEITKQKSQPLKQDKDTSNAETITPFTEKEQNGKEQSKNRKKPTDKSTYRSCSRGSKLSPTSEIMQKTMKPVTSSPKQKEIPKSELKSLQFQEPPKGEKNKIGRSSTANTEPSTTQAKRIDSRKSTSKSKERSNIKTTETLKSHPPGICQFTSLPEKYMARQPLSTIDQNAQQLPACGKPPIDQSDNKVIQATISEKDPNAREKHKNETKSENLVMIDKSISPTCCQRKNRPSVSYVEKITNNLPLVNEHIEKFNNEQIEASSYEPVPKQDAATTLNNEQTQSSSKGPMPKQDAATILENQRRSSGVSDTTSTFASIEPHTHLNSSSNQYSQITKFKKEENERTKPDSVDESIQTTKTLFEGPDNPDIADISSIMEKERTSVPRADAVNNDDKSSKLFADKLVSTDKMQLTDPKTILESAIQESSNQVIVSEHKNSDEIAPLSDNLQFDSRKNYVHEQSKPRSQNKDQMSTNPSSVIGIKITDPSNVTYVSPKPEPTGLSWDPSVLSADSKPGKEYHSPNTSPVDKNTHHCSERCQADLTDSGCRITCLQEAISCSDCPSVQMKPKIENKDDAQERKHIEDIKYQIPGPIPSSSPKDTFKKPIRDSVFLTKHREERKKGVTKMPMSNPTNFSEARQENENVPPKELSSKQMDRENLSTHNLKNMSGSQLVRYKIASIDALCRKKEPGIRDAPDIHAAKFTDREIMDSAISEDYQASSTEENFELKPKLKAMPKRAPEKANCAMMREDTNCNCGCQNAGAREMCICLNYVASNISEEQQSLLSHTRQDQDYNAYVPPQSKLQSNMNSGINQDTIGNVAHVTDRQTKKGDYLASFTQYEIPSNTRSTTLGFKPPTYEELMDSREFFRNDDKILKPKEERVISFSGEVKPGNPRPGELEDLLAKDLSINVRPHNEHVKRKPQMVDAAVGNKLGTENIPEEETQAAMYVPNRDHKTYTIEASAEVEKLHRATSPVNTDQEISYMSDLPSEKTTNSSARARRRSCSPGEDKATTTYTDTGTSPSSPSPDQGNLPSTSAALSLSEGEIPQTDDYIQDQAAKRSKYPRKSITAYNELRETPSSKVEQTLEAISQELARCRKLLLNTKSHETKLPTPRPPTPPQREQDEPSYLEDSVLSASLSGLPPGSGPRGSNIALHAALGSSNIGGSPAPRAMFTLHIGTIVLSDEAMISYRDMQLVLTWKFYDQNVAMSHMRPGRVTHFDFSTEYDLKLTDHFLNYLKAEELQINVCEVHSVNQPLASCSLPLREALLHTNRRADMSLALVAGPSMVRANKDALDTRDEVGVLDMWCMLRAEPHVLPRINDAIASSNRAQKINTRGRQSTVKNVKSLSTLILTVDEQDERLSDRLEPNTLPPSPPPHAPPRRPPARAPPPRYSMLATEELPMMFSQRNVEPQADDDKYSSAQVSAYDYRASAPVSGYPPVLERSFTELKGSTSLGNMTYSNEISNISETRPQMQVSFEDNNNKYDKYEGFQSQSQRKSSGILINEVRPNIKTFDEMQKALMRNYKDETSRRISTRSSMTGATVNSLDDILLNPMSRDQRKNRNSMSGVRVEIGSLPGNELSKKYEDMKRLLGSKRNVDYKRVQIQNDETAADLLDAPHTKDYFERIRTQSIDITVLWLALNEECAAMNDPNVQRLYVAYNFLGRGGAELETPLSLPKPKQYQDKCVFNFKKSFQLSDADLAIMGRMARCRSTSKGHQMAGDSVCFTVVSEPVEDPLGINNCEDIGTALLYFGDLIEYSAGSDTYTDVIPVRTTQDPGSVCGVLAVRVDGLDVVRKSLMMNSTDTK